MIAARRATRELDNRAQEASIDVAVFELTLKLGSNHSGLPLSTIITER